MSRETDGAVAGRLPGATTPDRRLPVTMAAIRSGGPSLLRAAARRARPRPRAFPVGAPTWPTTVPRPPAERTLGTAYDTDWARRPPARVARAVIGEVARPVLAALADPTVAGLDRLAHLDEPVIFAANHASHLDAPLVLSILPERWRHRTVVAGAADYFFDTRLKAATFALTMNVVPIERTRVSRESASRAAGLLEEGWSLLIFPEGGRSPDGWGQSHRPGAAWLSVRTGRPVVPVHLEGTRAVLARGSSRLRAGHTTVSFGRPLRPTPGGDARRLAAELEAAIAALADEVATDWWGATRRAAAGSTPDLTGPGGVGAWRRTWALGAGRTGRRGGGGGPSWPAAGRRRA